MRCCAADSFQTVGCPRMKRSSACIVFIELSSLSISSISPNPFFGDRTLEGCHFLRFSFCGGLCCPTTCCRLVDVCNIASPAGSFSFARVFSIEWDDCFSVVSCNHNFPKNDGLSFCRRVDDVHFVNRSCRIVACPPYRLHRNLQLKEIRIAFSERNCHYRKN
jgi:hypothetical protein